MSENAYTRVAQAVVRLIAFGLMVTSLLLFVEELMHLFNYGGFTGGFNGGFNNGDVDMNGSHYVVFRVAPGKLFLKGIPFLIGLILFWKSRALAERLTKDLN